MGYEYREVKCCDCGHIFMWSKDFEWPYNQAYKLKETGEIIYEAKCPKCNKRMLVLPHVLEGTVADIPKLELMEISYE